MENDYFSITYVYQKKKNLHLIWKGQVLLGTKTNIEEKQH